MCTRGRVFFASIIAIVCATLMMIVASPVRASSDDCISLQVRTSVARIAWDDFRHYVDEGNDDLANASRDSFDHEMNVASDYAMRCDDDEKTVGKYYALTSFSEVYDINTFRVPFTKKNVDDAALTINLLYDYHYYKYDEPGYFSYQGNIASYYACLKLPYKLLKQPPAWSRDLTRLMGKRSPCKTASGMLVPK